MKSLEKYINLPYKHKGRDFSGVDCFGIIWLIFKNERNIILPDFTDIGYDMDWQHRNENHILNNLWNEWETVNKPYTIYDCVIFYSIGSIASHIGMFINEDKFIHISSKFSSRIDKIESNWSKIIYGVMRYKNA